MLRKLVDAGTRVVQLGFSGTEDAEIESVLDRAQQEVFAVAQRKTAEDYRVLGISLTPPLMSSPPCSKPAAWS